MSLLSASFMLGEAGAFAHVEKMLWPDVPGVRKREITL